jgi:hypothetical protein
MIDSKKRLGHSPGTPQRQSISEKQNPNVYIPGKSDREVRRFRIFRFDFDSRPRILEEALNEDWDAEVKMQWKANRKNLMVSLKSEYGEHQFDRKVADFASFGSKPFSIIAHHNSLFDDVRSAFVTGAYYAALTSACALGERILNHLVLDLREHYKASTGYKKVYRKKSFAAWQLAIDVLVEWNVLLPKVEAEFRELELLRNRSIHFNQETTDRLRDDALQAIGHLRTIIENQFSAFGLQPWFIEGVAGASFIKREWEQNPFVSHYYLPGNHCVGPYHSVEFLPTGGLQFVDHPDYGTFGVESLTDEQFRDVFNDASPEFRAQSAS